MGNDINTHLACRCYIDAVTLRHRRKRRQFHSGNRHCLTRPEAAATLCGGDKMIILNLFHEEFQITVIDEHRHSRLHIAVNSFHGHIDGIGNAWTVNR